VLNQVYANVLGRPVLVPTKSTTSVGSAIFAFMAAGAFKNIEEAQDKICPPHKTYTPEAGEQRIYDELYRLFSRLYFEFGKAAGQMGHILPGLIRISEMRHKGAAASDKA